MKSSYATSRWSSETPSSSARVTYDTEMINKDIARYTLELLRRKNTQHPILNKLSSQLDLVDKGLDAQLPCRFELFHCALTSSAAPCLDPSVSVSIILDMAHNEGGIQALVWRLKHLYPNRRYRRPTLPLLLVAHG
jgi:folylpolyglutamate synthase/dihydropteroate synthase